MEPIPVIVQTAEDFLKIPDVSIIRSDDFKRHSIRIGILVSLWDNEESSSITRERSSSKIVEFELEEAVFGFLGFLNGFLWLLIIISSKLCSATDWMYLYNVLIPIPNWWLLCISGEARVSAHGNFKFKTNEIFDKNWFGYEKKWFKKLNSYLKEASSRDHSLFSLWYREVPH